MFQLVYKAYDGFIGPVYIYSSLKDRRPGVGTHRPCTQQSGTMTSRSRRGLTPPPSSDRHFGSKLQTPSEAAFIYLFCSLPKSRQPSARWRPLCRVGTQPSKPFVGCGTKGLSMVCRYASPASWDSFC